MIVLGFDTATPATAVGLRLADGSTLQARDDPRAGERPGHSTRLLPLARGLLAEAGLGWSDLDRVAVGVGPGTFTGLRIGVATARGLAQSLNLALAGVSSLQALAHAVGDVTAGEVDGVLAVIDARRGEAFAAAYCAGAELLARRALAPQGLAGMLAQAGAGEGPGRWLAVGDGAVRFRDHLEAVGVMVPIDDSSLHGVTGEAICALGERSVEADVQAIVPDYGRRPDAEIALEGAAT